MKNENAERGALSRNASREELLRQLDAQRLEAFIFNDQHPGDATQELLRLYGRPFLSNLFVMILVGPRRRQTRAHTFHGVPMHQVRELLLPVLEQYGNAAIFPMMDMSVCVLNPPAGLSDSPGGWTGALEADLTHCLAAHPEAAQLRCAVGAMNQGPNIQQLYRTAEIVWDQGADKPQQVTTWYTIPWNYLEKRAEEEMESDLASLERQFMNFVNGRQFYDAVAALDQIIHIHIWKTHGTLRHVRSSVFFRLETVLSVCGVSIDPDQTRSDVYDALERVMHSFDFQELRGCTYDFFALLEDLLSQQASKAKKAASIREFIDQTYSDPNLDASMLCQRFKLSEVYLSRVFKETFQMSWLDYIHAVRLEQAKKLLLTTDLNVGDIAEAVGSTPRTMARLFKAAEGVSPGAYREAAWHNA